MNADVSASSDSSERSDEGGIKRGTAAVVCRERHRHKEDLW
jgi:hypothetical protein